MIDERGAARTPDIFSAPRRYDLSTMFVVSIGYAALFASLKALGATPLVHFTFGGLVTVVGIAQALMFHGKRPRAASCIGGSAFLVFATVWTTWLYSRERSLAILVNGTLASVFCLMLPSILAGYLTGALVGGVFLMAHHLRRYIERRRRS